MEQLPTHEHIIQEEIMCDDMQMLNKNLKDKNNLILSVNIRRLNANFVKLEVFVDSLITKSCIIICTETWNLEYFQLYQLSGYKIFYNESKINQNDGIVIYIRNDTT